MNTGKLIVLDGTDGSGKATQAGLLFQRLKGLGKDVVKIDFPQYQDNFFGKLIRECLDGKRGDFLGIDPKIASVLYAADRWESSRKIKQWLEEGKVVICDRYVSANQIHQGGKISDDEKRKEFLSWLDEAEHSVFGIPRPDLIIYLNVPVEVSRELMIKRASESGVPRDLAEENAQHLLDSQSAAMQIVKDLNNWVKIDCAKDGGMRSREDIHEDVFLNILCLYK